MWRKREPETYWDIVRPDFKQRFRQAREATSEVPPFNRNEARVLGAVATLTELGHRPIGGEVGDNAGVGPAVDGILNTLTLKGLVMGVDEPLVEMLEHGRHLPEIQYTPTPIGSLVAQPLLALEQMGRLLGDKHK